MTVGLCIVAAGCAHFLFDLIDLDFSFFFFFIPGLCLEDEHGVLLSHYSIRSIISSFVLKYV